MEIEKMDFDPNQEYNPGVSEIEILVAPLDEFLTIGTVPKLSEAASFEAAGTIADAHTFDSDKGFTPLTILPDTGGIDDESAGEKGNMSFSNGFKGTIAGVTAKNIGFSRWGMNRPMVILVPDKQGNHRQIGSALSPAYFTEIKPTSGIKSGDVNGIPFVVSTTQVTPAPFYTGAITKKTFA